MDSKPELHRLGYRQQFESRIDATAASKRVPLAAFGRTNSPTAKKPIVPATTKGIKRVSFQDASRSMVPPTTMTTNHASTTCTTLADTFQKHGMRMCDGSKMNAVNKQIDAVGKLPAAMAEHLSGLYLSQNNLQSLANMDQFVNLKHLSIGGNLLDRFSELECLKPLTRLRNLNLIGNPLCLQPNYRLRVVDCLKQLALLDGKEISSQEKLLANEIACQDQKCRALMLTNHTKIQTLERITRWVRVRKDFYGLVISAMTGTGGRFDQVPSLEQVDFNVDRLLHVWQPQQPPNPRTKRQLARTELGLVNIVIRTHTKLQDDGKAKAKEFLLNLATTQHQSKQLLQQRGRPTPKKSSFLSDKRAEWEVWEEAYSRVLCLQQSSITQLLGDIERSRSETLDYVKDLLVMDPQARQQQISVLCRRSSKKRSLRIDHPTPMRDMAQSIAADLTEAAPTVSTAEQTDDELLFKWLQYPLDTVYPSKDSLPPQQMDPDWPEEVQPFAANPQQDEQRVHTSRLRSSLAPPPPVNWSKEIQNPPPVPLQSPKQTRSASKRLNCSSVSPESSKQKSDVVGHEHTPARPPSNAPSPKRPEGPKESIEAESQVRPPSSVSSHVTTCFPSKPSPRIHEFLANCSDPVDLVIEMINNNSNTSATVTPESSRDREHRLELERREAQYIKALMESEQRELDLRNQLASVAKKNLVLHQHLQQKEDVRQVAKQKANQLALERAKPIVLKRCMTRWQHFCLQSIRRNQFRLAMLLKTKQRLFRRWRMHTWRCEMLQRFQHKLRLKMLWRCFMEWANVSRLQAHQRAKLFQKQGQFLHQVFTAWRERTERTLWIQSRIKQQWIPLQNQYLTRVCFQNWKHMHRRRRQQMHLVQLLWQNHQQPMLKRLVFMHWKLFVIQFARVYRARASNAIGKQNHQLLLHCFVGWRKWVKCFRTLQRREVRKWFVRWQSRFRSRHHGHQALLASRHAIVQSMLTRWKQWTSRRRARKWSLALAQRFMVHKHKARHWRAWKWFASCRKQYYQSSAKALKHLFRCILRKTWRAWHFQTRHLRLGKTHASRRCLRTCFATWKRYRCGRHEVKRSRRRWHHYHKLLTNSRARRLLQFWFNLVRQRKTQVQLARAVASKRSLRSLAFFWNQWRRQQLDRLQKRFGQALDELKTVTRDYDELQEAFRGAQQESLCFAERNCAANAKMETQDAQLCDMQRLLSKQTQQVKVLQQMLDKHRQDSKQKQQEVAQMTANWNTLRNQLAQERDELKKENHQLVATKEQLQARLDSLHATNEELLAQLDKKTQQCKQNQQCVDLWESKCTQLEEQKAQEESQRKETASKLQSYEQQIQATCQEVIARENRFTREQQLLQQQIQDQQRQLQSCQVQMDEMSRLVHKKNEQIIRLEQTAAQADQARQEWEARAQALVRQLEHQQDATARMNRMEREQVEQEKKLAKTKTNEIAIEELLKEIHHSIVQKQDQMVETFSPKHRHGRPVGSTKTQKETMVSRVLQRRSPDWRQPHAAEDPQVFPSQGLVSVDQAKDKENEQANENDSLQDNRKQVGWRRAAASSSSTTNSSQRSCFGGFSNSFDTGIDDRTQKIHEDLRLLQQKLTKTLEQKPIHAQELVSSAISSTLARNMLSASDADDEDSPQDAVIPLLTSSSSSVSSQSSLLLQNTKKPVQKRPKSRVCISESQAQGKSKPKALKRVKKTKRSIQKSCSKASIKASTPVHLPKTLRNSHPVPHGGAELTMGAVSKRSK